MTKRIAVGVGLLLTLGSALGGTFIYAQSGSVNTAPVGLIDQQPPSPYMIAMWKATATSTQFVSPKVPL